MDLTGAWTRRRPIRLAVALLGVTALVLLGVQLGGGDSTDPLDDILTIVFALAAVGAVAAWIHERRAATARAARGEQLRGELAERERSLEAGSREKEKKLAKLDQQLREQRQAVLDERRRRLRTEAARQAEREWSGELREEVARLHRDQGPSGNLHELVLAVAMRLTGAEKGLLLSRRDDDGDGDLDLVTHRGFDHDPSHSDVAQRFADRVVERGKVVREDEPGSGDSPADAEIHTLVAIPVYISDDFEGVVVCANRPGGFEELDDHVLLALGDHAGAVLQNGRLHGRLRSSYLAVVRMLADAIEAKDPFSRARSAEVSHYVDAVAKRLDFDAERREQLLYASVLHDVGKLGISERVLLKGGPLGPDEREIVDLHPLIGSRILERIPGLRELAPAIRHHHERWDGTGYPTGLAGQGIPIEARLIHVADCFSAMTSPRPYRRQLGDAEACREIEACAGTQFDPEITRLFVEEVRRRPAIQESDGALAAALDDPTVQAHRTQGEPLLGHGPVAVTDPLTLLYSHRYLQEVANIEAQRALRNHRPFSVVMVELTELSEINRRDGYAAGDLAMQEAARAVDAVAGAASAIAARYSGRRLAIVIPSTGHHGAAELATEVTARLEGSGVRVRTGVAVWQHGDHGHDVIARARIVLEATVAR